MAKSHVFTDMLKECKNPVRRPVLIGPGDGHPVRKGSFLEQPLSRYRDVISEHSFKHTSQDQANWKSWGDFYV